MTGSVGPTATTWEQLVGGLADTLRRLEDRVGMTISWSSVPTVYVQVEQSSSDTVALTGADDVLGVDRDSRLDARRFLEQAGWDPPGSDPTGRRTWRRRLPWPSRGEEYERLAVRCVDVLRLLHGVPGSEELEYLAWRDAEPPPEHRTYAEEGLEPPVPHVVLPRLGLRDAYRS